ncbi:hypothetical protein DSAG12_04035 [Promethearchaeum syntrophicum]|uniref:Uncharacterized protein n=1 Tax=Promethearchaeum syntrophicum TaxID=2594042 RepID=A0AC61ZTW5_9ARCH|nr:hypothetical protein [Candidatus Prometheoarchaeum syntrophicum]
MHTLKLGLNPSEDPVSKFPGFRLVNISNFISVGVFLLKRNWL